MARTGTGFTLNKRKRIEPRSVPLFSANLITEFSIRGTLFEEGKIGRGLDGLLVDRRDFHDPYYTR